MQAFKPGSQVILTTAPQSLLQNLPEEDQEAIRAIVGSPVTFAGYSWGQAELEFTDREGAGHSIWVDDSLIKRA
jgi:hypothetical protein